MKQCVGTEGVEPDYVRTEVLPEFFRSFWVRRMALDRRNYRQLVETTIELANKVALLMDIPYAWFLIPLHGSLFLCMAWEAGLDNVAH